MDLQTYLYKVKHNVERELNLFFDQESKLAKHTGGPLNQDTIEFLREFVLRGKSKRIRAGLVYLGYELFGGKNRQAILKAAMAYELIHAAWLIHDDIIDKDNLRRGRPAMHKMMANWLKKKGLKQNLEHFGISMAILAGDIAVIMSEKILFSAEFKNGKIINILNVFYRTMMDTVYGEILDVLLPPLKKEKNQTQDILRICELKTARYTFGGPLHLGAMAANAKGQDLKQVLDYAIPVGIAFQIRDDNIGMFGSSQEIGKQAGSDLEEGKITLLILKTLELANKTQKATIIRLLKKSSITKQDLNQARKIIKETGAFDRTQKYAEKLVSQGKKTLIQLKKVNPQRKELLILLADYIIKRKY